MNEWEVHERIAAIDPWDTRARKSIVYAMNWLTEAMWAGRGNQGSWFVFGGCLFLLLLWWAVALYYAAKVTLWLGAEVALFLALGAVVVTGGVWRAAMVFRR